MLYHLISGRKGNQLHLDVSPEIVRKPSQRKHPSHKYIATKSQPKRASHKHIATKSQPKRASHKHIATKNHPQSSKHSRYTCEACGKTFQYRSQLDIHYTSEKKFKCSECHKYYCSKHTLEKHIKTIHRRCVNYPCSLCEKSFTSQGHLNRHIKDVHEKKKTFTCTVCKKTFAQKANCQFHIRNDHQKSKLLTCQYCGKRYSKEAWCLQHMEKCDKNNHGKVKIKSIKDAEYPSTDRFMEFSCTQCTKIFRTETELENHVKEDHMETSDRNKSKNTNDNDHDSDFKPIRCTDCPKTFQRQAWLDKHMKKHHTDPTSSVIQHPPPSDHWITHQNKDPCNICPPD